MGCFLCVHYSRMLTPAQMRRTKDSFTMLMISRHLLLDILSFRRYYIHIQQRWRWWSQPLYLQIFIHAFDWSAFDQDTSFLPVTCYIISHWLNHHVECHPLADRMDAICIFLWFDFFLIYSFESYILTWFNR